jgi:uncharacterized protein YjbI with pentapeptide repeats
MPNIKDVERAKQGDKKLMSADLSEADLQGIDLSGADLTDANLSNALLRKANLTKAKLFSADLSGADLSGASLIEADLTEANVELTKFDRCVLSGANLMGAHASDASFRYAILVAADFSHATLQAADFQKSVLTDVLFIGANLTVANMDGANLWNANFRDAYVGGAYFVGANLNGTDFMGARGLSDFQIRRADVLRTTKLPASLKEFSEEDGAQSLSGKNTRNSKTNTKIGSVDHRRNLGVIATDMAAVLKVLKRNHEATKPNSPEDLAEWNDVDALYEKLLRLTDELLIVIQNTNNKQQISERLNEIGYAMLDGISEKSNLMGRAVGVGVVAGSVYAFLDAVNMPTVASTLIACMAAGSAELSKIRKSIWPSKRVKKKATKKATTRNK